MFTASSFLFRCLARFFTIEAYDSPWKPYFRSSIVDSVSEGGSAYV